MLALAAGALVVAAVVDTVAAAAATENATDVEVGAISLGKLLLNQRSKQDAHHSSDCTSGGGGQGGGYGGGYGGGQGGGGGGNFGRGNTTTCYV